VIVNARHDTSEEFVAGVVAADVANAAGGVGVHVGEQQPGAAAVAALAFVVKVNQAGLACACSCQRIGLDDRDVVGERVTVCKCVASLSSGVCAIASRGLAIKRCQSELLSALGAALGGAPALGRGAHDDLSAADRTDLRRVLVGDVALSDRLIASLRGTIACQRRLVTDLGDPVTRSTGVQARLRDVLAMKRAALTHVTTQRMRFGVATASQIAIAGGLIDVAGELIAVAGGPIDVAGELIAVAGGPIAVAGGVIAVGCQLIIRSVPAVTV
jgi:hypothetical protein